MKRKIHFFVEGDTERRFILTVLQVHFDQFPVELVPVPISKRKIIRGSFDRGGTAVKSLTVAEIKRSILAQDVIAVTTMLDYFKLHQSYGRKSIEGSSDLEIALIMESLLRKELNDHPKFVPYLQLHDFEALLFSSPEKIATILGEKSKVIDHLRKVRNQFPNPESIDDKTPPFYQLEKICKKYLGKDIYQKTTHGNLIAKEIGLSTIRSQCPHFDQWLTELENRAQQAMSSPES
jgi:hypothetical protein